MPSIEEVSERTRVLLRALAYEGEVDADAVVASTGVRLEQLHEAAVKGWFKVWFFGDDLAALQLTDEGYLVARELLRCEAR